MFQFILIFFFLYGNEGAFLSNSSSTLSSQVNNSKIELNDENVNQDDPNTISYSCAGCVNDKYKVTHEQLTALRIEYIKHQILSTLHLTKPPKITLPKISSTDNTINASPTDDDFYERKISFFKDDVKCYHKVRGASVCLPFNMSIGVPESALKMAELWLYKLKDKVDNHSQTFVISELAHWSSNKSFPKMKPIAIHDANLTQNWMIIDITAIARNWIEYQDTLRLINVECKTCESNRSSILTKKDGFKPFLRLKIFSENQKKINKLRSKRSLNCIRGINECCKDTLYISFAELGWNNWILSPSGYNAYFCRGSCSTAAAITLVEPNYNTIIQKMLYGSRISRKLELIPCCAASKFKPLELTYANNKSFITKKRLPNMIVDTCGCM